MLKSIITSITVLSSWAVFSQASENRTVSDFSKLKSSAGVKVFYTVSETRSVKVEAEDNEKLKFIKTQVDNGTLNVFVDSGNGKKGNWKGVRVKTANIFVSGPSLSSVKASSSSRIKIENLNTASQVDIAVSSSAGISGKFSCAEISIDASSSGDFKGEVDAKSVQIEASSSSDVNLKGKTEWLKVDASSSASCDANKLFAADANVTASSSSDVDLYVSNSLNAKATSSADITYLGNPSKVVVDKSSSGSVTKK